MPDLLEPPYGPANRVRPPRSVCRSYARGHAPHPVHVQLCQDDPGEHWLPVVVMGVEGDLVTVAAEEELRRYRNHEADHLAALVRDTGPAAILNEHFGVLFLSSWPGDADSVFSLLAADQPLEPCREPGTWFA